MVLLRIEAECRRRRNAASVFQHATTKLKQILIVVNRHSERCKLFRGCDRERHVELRLSRNSHIRERHRYHGRQKRMRVVDEHSRNHRCRRRNGEAIDICNGSGSQANLRHSNIMLIFGHELKHKVAGCRDGNLSVRTIVFQHRSIIFNSKLPACQCFAARHLERNSHCFKRIDLPVFCRHAHDRRQYRMRIPDEHGSLRIIGRHLKAIAVNCLKVTY